MGNNNSGNLNTGNQIIGGSNNSISISSNEKNPTDNKPFNPKDFKKKEDFNPNKDSQYPTVFISYSWESQSHTDWVLNLANRLGKNTHIILDRFELSAGKNSIKFMEKAIADSDKVLIIFTPNYKLKAEERKGGVGYEYSIMSAELYTTITNNKKVIPILKSGTISESIPLYLNQLITIDMTKEENFEEKFSELLHAIYDEPVFKKPQPDTRPF